MPGRPTELFVLLIACLLVALVVGLCGSCAA